jgi:hypothetical protein
MAVSGLEWSGDEDRSPAQYFGLPRWARVVSGLLDVRGLAPGGAAIELWAPGFDACEVPFSVAEGACADLGEVRLVVAAEPAKATPEWAQPALAPRSGRRRTEF